MNKEIKKYLRRVRAWLPCTTKRKRVILQSLREDISLFSQDQPNPSFDDLLQRFGTPQQIASAFVDEMGSMELLRDLRVRRRVITIAIVAAMTVILIWAIAVGIALIDEQNSSGGGISSIISIIQ